MDKFSKADKRAILEDFWDMIFGNPAFVGTDPSELFPESWVDLETNTIYLCKDDQKRPSFKLKLTATKEVFK